MSADRPPCFRTPNWYLTGIPGVQVINGVAKPGYRTRYDAKFGTVEENRRKRLGRGRNKREAAREGVVREGEWGWGSEGRVKREEIKREEVKWEGGIKREAGVMRLFGEGGSGKFAPLFGLFGLLFGLMLGLMFGLMFAVNNEKRICQSDSLPHPPPPLTRTT